VVKTMAQKAKRTKKRIEEVVQFALGHKTRVHILILLNEGIYTASELATMMDEPLNNVHKHIGKMLEDGSIEIAIEEETGNLTRYRYKAVETQCYQQEEFEQLPFTYRQNITGAIIQSGTAEVMAGFYAGSLADPRACCYWDWYNLDAQGRRDAESLNLRYLNELREIEVESTNRAARSGEETTSMLLHNMFFERPRKGLSRAIRLGRSPFGNRGALRD
jgi:DNA-binding transcriptional ArsR family regulator